MGYNGMPDGRGFNDVHMPWGTKNSSKLWMVVQNNGMPDGRGFNDVHMPWGTKNSSKLWMVVQNIHEAHAHTCHVHIICMCMYMSYMCTAACTPHTHI